jgi:NADH dehydrogenase
MWFIVNLCGGCSIHNCQRLVHVAAFYSDEFQPLHLVSIPQHTVLLTGATGFIGRRVLTRLATRSGTRVIAIARRPLPASPTIIEIRADLRNPATYESALDGVDVVLHLAAATGSVSAPEHFEMNRNVTRALLDVCRNRGVTRFVYVSSIAAKYHAREHYPYAQSKRAAEESVRASGVNHLIVRPTMVLGDGGPIWNSLSALASLPVLPVFGDGTVKVQPVWVEDVARFLESTIDLELLPNRAVDLGGPDVLTFEQLLRKIRRLLKGRESPVVHIPVRALTRFLVFVERRISTRLPVSAGQFTAFVEDSVADHDSLTAALIPDMAYIDDVLRRLTSRA